MSAQVLWPWEQPVDFDRLAGTCPECGVQGWAAHYSQVATRVDGDAFTAQFPGEIGATLVFEGQHRDFTLRRAECPNGHKWGPDA